MRLYFPAANGLHPVPEHCQEKPSNNNGERKMELWLLWVLPKNRPRPGTMFVSRENQIWPHFPENHLQPPSRHTASDFLSFPPAPFCEVLLDLQIISLHFSCFQSLPDFHFGNYKERNGELSVMTCQVKAGMKFYSKTLLSFFPHTPCPPGPEFMGCLLF